MILPRLVSIDTYIFAKLADDFFSEDKKSKEKAINTINHLIKEGLVPFISFHHIQEILQHENDNVVSKRWALIKEFPTIAWMCSYDNSSVLGSIIDIHQMEIKSLLEHHEHNVKVLFQEFRKRLLKYSTGEKFVSFFEPLYCSLRDLGMIDTQRRKAIESISHVRDKSDDKTKLSELNKLTLRNPDEVKRFMAKYQKHLAQLLDAQGDKKLLNIDLVANKFTKEVEGKGQKLYAESNLSLLDAFVVNAGVRLDQVTPETTLGELGYLGIYNSKVEQLILSLGYSKERACELSPESQTTWVIWEYLDKAMKFEKRAQGSNIVDKHMSVLALYVDVFTVDKRVKEYFRQLERKNSVLSGNFSNIVKLSNYSGLNYIN